MHKQAEPGYVFTVQPNNNTSNNNYNGGNACVIREQDQYMPIANVIRIMRRILPSHAKISDDAKETIQECVSEYISFITGEANERCQREQRKTVTAEDVLWAMGKLGFDNYVGPLSIYLNRYRELENDRTRSEPPFVKRSVDFGPSQFGLSSPYGPGYHLGHYPGMYDAAVVSIMGGYYRDGSGSAGGSGSSSSQNDLPGYDPYVHDEFK